jgi:hypothetical protein
METYQPNTIIEAVTYFSSPENCSEFVKRVHWNNINATSPQGSSLNIILHEFI